jgi:hypothetical protein
LSWVRLCAVRGYKPDFYKLNNTPVTGAGREVLSFGQCQPGVVIKMTFDAILAGLDVDESQLAVPTAFRAWPPLFVVVGAFQACDP